MFSAWNKTRRRRELLEEPFPRAWSDWLRQNVRHFAFLNDQQRRRLEGFAQVTVAEKTWDGGSGFEVTDEMKVTIAGFAGIMTLGLSEAYYFDRLKSIIIYPGAYVPHESRFNVRSHVELLTPRLGESWYGGPVVLSWGEIAGTKRERPGNNLVIHEFAHHVDGLDGDVDGSPPIVGREKTRTWYRVTENEFERLRQSASRNEATLLDRYGASNRAEFFAVASECFFERPNAMRKQHAELYQVLADFYGQDIANWLPDAIEQETAPEVHKPH